MEKEMKTPVEMINKLREKQFLYDFEIIDGRFICKETNESFLPGDLIIEKTYRYEGDSDPSDATIIYAISSSTGTKGIIMDAYGAYANAKISEAIKQVPVKEADENPVS